MDTQSLFYELQLYLKNQFPYNDYIIDLANNPFLIVSFIGEDRAVSYSTYLTPRHEAHSSKYDTPTNFALSSVLQITCLKESQEKPTPASTEFGYCNAIMLDGIMVLISIVANPEDAQFIYTSLKNQIEILYAHQEAK